MTLLIALGALMTAGCGSAWKRVDARAVDETTLDLGSETARFTLADKRVIEMHVGQEQVIDLLARDTNLVQCSQQARSRGAGSRVHERRATAVDDEVARGVSWADIKRVDQVDAIAEGPRERLRGNAARRIRQRPLHLPCRRTSSVEQRLGRWLE